MIQKDNLRIFTIRQGSYGVSCNQGGSGKISLGIGNSCTEGTQYWVHLNRKNAGRLRDYLVKLLK